MEHKTCGKSLDDTINKLSLIVEDKESLLAACIHYLKEYRELLNLKNKETLYTIDMTKRDKAIKFCRGIKTGNKNYLKLCKDNLKLLEDGETEGFAGCPMNYGLDGCRELCEDDGRNYIPDAEMRNMCKTCWKLAIGECDS